MRRIRLNLTLSNVVLASVLSLLAGETLASPGPPSAVGLSQGKLSAQPSGALTYEMPIVVTPGTAGVQPKLAFQYSSGGRNGPLGVGWSLGGVSAITRAPQTTAQDNAIHGVDLTLNDRYSLDGQRLIAVNGNDGIAGSEYRTEINSFTKVVANGNSGNGPATFTAWTKSGLIYTFGGANGATFVPGGSATPLTWLVSKIQDQAGNYMTFWYTAEGNLSQINYTMNDGAGLSSYASVLCTYDSITSTQPRPDPAYGHIAGVNVQTTERLSKLTSYYGSTVVREYQLAYETSGSTQKSRLTSITESARDDNGLTISYPPTTFAWTADGTAFDFVPSLHQAGANNVCAYQQGDFDGDGLADLVRMKGSAIQVLKVLSGNLLNAGSFSTNQTFDTTDTWLQGDFSSDGKLDLIRVHGSNGNNVHFSIFTNSGTNAPGTAFNSSGDPDAGGPLFYSWRQFIAMDANGDGKLDIVGINGSGDDSNPPPLKLTVYKNTALPGQAPTFSALNWFDGDPSVAVDKCKTTDRWLAGDFNGDGLPDLAKVFNSGGKNSIRVYLNQNGSFSAATWDSQRKSFFESDGTTPAYVWITGDFNGDGLTDMARIPKTNNPDNENQMQVFISTGTGFETPRYWLSLTVGETATVQVGDYNADGRSDLMVMKDHLKGSNTSSAPPNSSGLPIPIDSLVPLPDLPYAPELVGLLLFGDDPLAPLASSDAPTMANGGTPPTYTYTCARGLYLSKGFKDATGKGGFVIAKVADEGDIQSTSLPQFQKTFTADFDGDGREDLVRYFTTTDSNNSKQADFNEYLSTSGFPDLLQSVTDGMGVTTSVDYQPLTGINGIPVFRKSTDAIAPVIDLIEPMPVVATITYDNGLGAAGSTGSTYSVNFSYEGLKADPQRGMLGFKTIEAIDSRAVDGQPGAHLHSKTWLKQGFPFTGMAEHTQSFLDYGNGSTRVLSDTTTLYAAGPTENNNSRIYFPYAQDSHVFAWDLGGAPLNDTETIVPTTGGVDMYGNTTQSIVKKKDFATGDFFTQTTTSGYNPADTTKWRIGQVSGSSVTSQAPGPQLAGQNPITRSSGFGYKPDNGQVNLEQIQSSNTNTMQTDYEFDSFGNTKKTTISGNAMSPVGPNDTANRSRVTQTTYDPQGRFLQTTVNALNQIESKLYDPLFGGVTSVTGPNGISDTAKYDGFGRKIHSTRFAGVAPINSDTSYEWVAANPNPINPPTGAVYLVRETADDAPRAITYFDRLGRELRKETITADGQTVFVDTTYDYRGRKSTVTRPYVNGASPVAAITSYDALDRPVLLQVQSVNENGDHVTATTSTFYSGLTTSITNPKNQTTTTTKDAAGHVVQVVDALSGTISYTYDALGELLTTADAAGNGATIHYDDRGRKTSVDDPDLGLWTYHYYSTGELMDQTDAKGQTVQFYYDQLGRMTYRKELTTGDIAQWTYDYYTDANRGRGKLRSVVVQKNNQQSYANTIDYDSLGRLANQSGSINGTTYTTGTGYDQYSRPNSLRYPTGFTVTQAYTNGYLTDVKSADGSTTYWHGKNYDADGHVTEEQLGNAAITTDRVYIPENGLLKQIKSYAGLNTSPSVQNLDYGFDVLGNLMRRTDNNQTINGNTLTENFVYDDLNRLTSAQVAGQTAKTFQYDRINGTNKSLGNIAYKADVGNYDYTPAAGSLQPGERPHPHAVRRINGGPDFTYDMNGNMTSGNGRTITWTWFNMPARIQNASASSYFDYDADHNRIMQFGTGPMTIYVGGSFERVDDGTNWTYKHYISAPTGRVAVYTKKINRTNGTVVEENTRYLMRDHLGSVDVVTNESGTVLEWDSFDAWGYRRYTRTNNSNTWQTPLPIPTSVPSSLRSIVSRGFTDHEELDDFGLVHMNGRIYDPGIGRFLSADPFVQAPMVSQNLNRYSYVVNNPLSLSDPTGFNIFGDFFNWLNQSLGSTGAQIVIGLVAVATVITFQYYVMPALVAAVAPALVGTQAAFVVSAAGAGFAGAFTSTILSGASLGQALESGLIAGAGAAITAGLIGPALHQLGDTKTFLGIAEKSVGHGITGGLLNAAEQKLENGSFRDGFLSGFISGLATPLINAVARGTSQLAIAERTVLSAAVGGTAAELGGGKFANGAVTAAFLQMYNDERQYFLDQEQAQKLKVTYNQYEMIKQYQTYYALARLLYTSADPALVALAYGLDVLAGNLKNQLVNMGLQRFTFPYSSDPIKFGDPRQGPGTPQIQYGDPRTGPGRPEIFYGDPRLGPGTPEIQYGDPRQGQNPGFNFGH